MTNENELLNRKRELMKRRLGIRAVDDFPLFMPYVNLAYDLQWFHRIIAEHCQRLLNGEIRNLMVFVPPQHGKSEIVSRNFPAWALGQNPDLKIVGCSYSAELSRQFSRSIQRIIDSAEYATIFPDTYLNGSNVVTTKGYLRNVDIFETVGHRGFYKCVGVGGSLTGTPVDIGIIDDPVKDALEAYSETYRNRVWEWYLSVFLTRLHNESRQLFIMTRWHEDDLAGRILKREPDKWTVLKIPALRETSEDGNDFDPREVGEALWENRHSRERLLEQKKRSERNFSALYQQNPTIEGGNIIKEKWFRRITKADYHALHFHEPIHFFLDTAYNKKQKSDNDPSGIIGACKIRNNIYITCAQKVYKEFPDLIRYLPDFMAANDASGESTLRIEPKANGVSVCQQLQESSSLNVTYTPSPTDPKDTRLYAVAPKVECGRVYLVEGDWNEEFIDEVCGFPAKTHDEYVDILGYAINYFVDDSFEVPEYVSSMLAI